MGGAATLQLPNPHSHQTSTPRRAGTRSNPFPVGSEVEVRTNEEEFRYTYFSATVISPPVAVSRKKGNKKKSKKIEVEYHTLFEEVDKSKRLKEKVDVRCVRPPPPPLEEVLEGFEPGDSVDAFFQDGWWIGAVARVVELEGEEKRYHVAFHHPPDEREFRVSELRVHWEWNNGRWVRLRPHRQDITNPSSKGGVHEQLTCENPSSSVSTVPVNNLSDGKDPCSGKASDQVDDSPGFQKTPHVRDHKTNKRGTPLKTPIKSIETLPTDDLNEKDDDPRIIPEVEAIVMETLQVPNQEKTTLNNDNPINVRSDTNGTNLTFSRKRREVVVEESTNPEENHVPKRGRRHSAIPQVQDLLGASRGKSMEVNSTLEVNIVCEAPSHEFENQPLSKWIEGILNNPSAVGVSKASPVSKNGEKNHMDIEVLDKFSEKHQASEALIPAKNLPFVKKSLLWKTVETMEAFQRIPQSPHFQPLEDIKESLREGKAIGYMVTFADVVGKISELQFDDDSKDVIDEMMETLAELEIYGFNVRPIQDCVAKLLAVKEKEANLLGNVNDLKDRILERHQKKDKIEEEIDGIKEEIRKLNERLLVAESAKEKEEDELVDFADQLKEIEKSIQNTRRDFEGIRSWPF